MEEIVKALKSGNLESLENVVLLYQNRIYSYILKMTRNKEDAMDLTQDVFVTVYQKIGHFKVNDSFMAWIYKIAKNKTLNHLKKQNIKALLDFKTEGDRYDEPFFDELGSFDVQIETSLDQLTMDEKNILLLRSVEELTYLELAQIYRMSEASVRKRYERAKRKFSDIYTKKVEVCNYARNGN